MLVSFVRERGWEGCRQGKAGIPFAQIKGGSVPEHHGLTYVMTRVMLYVMKKVNAVELRQSLGKVVKKLEAGGEPILLVRGKRIVAALISLKDFEERFVAKAASEARRRILEEMDEMARPSSIEADSSRLLRELRDHG